MGTEGECIIHQQGDCLAHCSFFSCKRSPHVGCASCRDISAFHPPSICPHPRYTSCTGDQRRNKLYDLRTCQMRIFREIEGSDGRVCHATSQERKPFARGQSKADSEAQTTGQSQHCSDSGLCFPCGSVVTCPSHLIQGHWKPHSPSFSVASTQTLGYMFSVYVATRRYRWVFTTITPVFPWTKDKAQLLVLGPDHRAAVTFPPDFQTY